MSSRTSPSMIDDLEESDIEETQIDPLSGDSKLRVNRFLTITEDSDFSAAKALRMFQERHTLDYGHRKTGSEPANDDYQYIPTFHLDMVSIVELPLQPITKWPGEFFANVTFSLQNWQAPYKIKHTTQGLPFNLKHRTMHIAKGSSRESWFVVLHPTRESTFQQDANAHANVARQHDQQQYEQRRGPKTAHNRTAVMRYHAEALALYITDLFLEGDLIGLGVEPSWTLGGRRSQTISLDKWAIFQTYFVERWSTFVASHRYDRFWTENEPAFHVYDFGQNKEIDDEQVARLPEDPALECDLSDDEGPSYVSDDTSLTLGSDDQEARGEDDSSEEDNDIVEFPTRSAGASRPHPAAFSISEDLFTGGLGELQRALDSADKMHSKGAATRTSCPAPFCLLADRLKTRDEYDHHRDLTFFPLAFHPRFGNFLSEQPPAFLHNPITVLKRTMSLPNHGADVLLFGFFQGYSNIKRTIRSRVEDLLASKEYTTAALDLPPSEARCRDAEAASCIQASMRAGRVSDGASLDGKSVAAEPRVAALPRGAVSHLPAHAVLPPEQVVRCATARLPAARIPGRALFLRPHVRLGLPGAAQPFRGPRRQRAGRPHDRGSSRAEQARALCFTGDPRVLPRTVLRHLSTTQSLEKGAWPFISPAMLGFWEAYGVMNNRMWPETPNGKARLAAYSCPRCQHSRRGAPAGEPRVSRDVDSADGAVHVAPDPIAADTRWPPPRCSAQYPSLGSTQGYLNGPRRVPRKPPFSLAPDRPRPIPHLDAFRRLPVAALLAIRA
ncbi:hypothetical protein G7054_g14787 [Neopestalotiopsis clavispora]|nr:hypothetical protein G7054_g14787 [Neopestalotiopsis clavispora]